VIVTCVYTCTYKLIRDLREDEELRQGKDKRRQPRYGDHHLRSAGALERMTNCQVSIDTHRRQNERRAG